MTLGTDLAPADRRGPFIGVFRMLPSLGAMAGPVVLGLVLDWLDIAGGALMGAGVGFTAAGWMVCCVKVCRTPCSSERMK